MSKPDGEPRLYTELAQWWPLLSPPSDYAAEARVYTHLLHTMGASPPATVLELGSGGGNNASHMKQSFEMTLVDASREMLEVSRALNPECEHHEGDMRSVRLNRLFDAVFVHDAICYMTSESDLREAVETAFVHLKPGGSVLLVPDYVRETFEPGTSHGGEDAPDGRGLRYLEWTFDPDPGDTEYTVDYAYVLREANGSVHVEHDRHLEGLFPRSTWHRILLGSGFTPLDMAPVPLEDNVFLQVFPALRVVTP